MAADSKIEIPSSMPAHSSGDLVPEIKTDIRRVYIVDIDATLLILGSDGLQLNPLLLKKLKEAPTGTIIYLVTKRCVETFHETLQQIEQIQYPNAKAKIEEYKKKLIISNLKKLKDIDIEIQGVCTANDHDVGEEAGFAYENYLKPIEEDILEKLDKGLPIDVKKEYGVPLEQIKSDLDAPETEENYNDHSKNIQIDLIAQKIRKRYPEAKFKYQLFDDSCTICDNARNSPLKPQVHQMDSFNYDPNIWKKYYPDLAALIGDTAGFYQVVEDVDTNGGQIFEMFGPTQAAVPIATHIISIPLAVKEKIIIAKEKIQRPHAAAWIQQAKRTDTSTLPSGEQQLFNKRLRIAQTILRTTLTEQPVYTGRALANGNAAANNMAEENKKTATTQLTGSQFFANRLTLKHKIRRLTTDVPTITVIHQEVQNTTEATQGDSCDIEIAAVTSTSQP